MRDTTFRFAALLLLAVLATGCGEPDHTASRDAYTTLQGDSGRLRDLQGRWLLINYWAEWCKPCIEELPELNEFQRRHGARAVLFSVNFDGLAGDELAAQVQKLGIETPVLLQDPASQLGVERPKALPTTFVFGPDGTLRQTLLGPQTQASLAASIGGQP